MGVQAGGLGVNEGVGWNLQIRMTMEMEQVLQAPALSAEKA